MSSKNDYYEISYLLKPTLSEEELLKADSQIKNFIGENDGIVESQTAPQRKVLGYDIKEFKDAFLSSVRFSISIEGLNKVEKNIKENDNIIRYLIIKSKFSAQKRAPHILSSIKAESPEKAETKSEVSSEDIDKKLDEILS